MAALFDGPSRLGVLRGADGTFEAVVYSADADADVAARVRVARTSLKGLGAYMLGGRIVEFTDRGYCDLIGVDPVCVAHLREEEKFRALGGIANVGVEERGWKAVARSMKEHPSEWAKAFAVSPLPPNHPLSNVVQGCASSYVGSSFLRVLHWEGKVLLAPFAKFTQLPFLRTLVIGETPPVEHIQWQSETGLFRIVGWAPLRHGLTSGAAVSDCIGSPSPRLSALLVKVSEVCKVDTPRLWSVDDLGS